MILRGKPHKDKSELLGAIGRRIAANRKETKDRKESMTQEELAAKAGVDRSQLGHIELGKVNARVETLHAITKALGITLGELFQDLG
jgi:transcriptional regulator with XRE-family HTH domain